MPGLHKTSTELEQAIVLRQGGYSLAAIADRTGISVSTLARAFKRLGVGKSGLTEEAIGQAKQQLLTDAGFLSDLRNEVASVILDDLVQFRRLRESIALTLDDVMNDANLPGHYRARAIAALTTSARLSQELIRRSLKIDELAPESSELPQLTILELTQEEVERMRNEQSKKDAVFDEPDVIDVVDEFSE